jgi:hypothetical protein
LSISPYLLKKGENKICLCRRNASKKLTNLWKPVLAAIASHISVFENIEFHFIGTGKRKPTIIVVII